MSTLVEDEEPERPEGVLESSLWCGNCLLPSGVRIPVLVQSWIKGFPVSSRQESIIVCLDCGRPVDEEGNPTGEPIPNFPGTE